MVTRGRNPKGPYSFAAMIPPSLIKGKKAKVPAQDVWKLPGRSATIARENLSEIWDGTTPVISATPDKARDNMSLALPNCSAG